MQTLSEISTPLFDYLESLGGNVDIVDGKKVIKNFDNLENEVDSLYNGVGLKDISHVGIIELKGKDVLDYLHRISTNSVKDLPKEGIINTIFTTEKGRIIDTATVMNFEDYQLLICSSENKPKLISWLNKYIINDDVKVADANGKYTLLELIGPQADAFVTLVCGNTVNNINPNSFKIYSTEGMIFFLLKIEDQNGKIKFWVLADPQNAKQFAQYSVENKGPFNFSLIGETAYNSYRIENGIPEAPNELNDQYNPHETGLTGQIDSHKGCYIGQEVIARLGSYDKVQKFLTGLIFEEEVNHEKPMELLTKDEKEAGVVTSTSYSYKLKKYIGLGYVKKSFIDEGSKLSAKVNGKSIVANIVKVPFKK